MDAWKIGEAKQRFSEIVRRSGEQPQRIYNRDRLVAAVVSPELLEEFERERKRRATKTLADTFSEIREICDDEGYELDTGSRSDRAGWLRDGS